ncbi:PQQ-dependent sugar dehydrogenase [Aquisediminimonas profunda]|uniref:PQQ-dependent sugar dehydrogenase n=1 Tax=Aquisediminimonas profunda TaxID=1550733 RepID=UPI001C6380A0|nr:sorbosone dehydrogenase family protein [Aquisediminimonas profunda]
MTWKSHLRNAAIIVVLLLAGAYWYLSSPDKARVALEDMQGQTPKLTTPRRENFPTINIAKVVGWPDGAKPVAASGLKVAAFAEKLDHPRWLLELPNGDILAAESWAPKRPSQGIGDKIARNIMSKADGIETSPDRITLLRDVNGDGVAEFRSVFLEGLHSPFGMALVGNTLYVANTDAVLAFPYKAGETKITAKGTKILDLPSSPPNNHWARNVVAAPDGQSLYITVGSNSNIAEGGMEKEKDRALIRQYDLKTGQSLVYAYGLRNPNGLAFNPKSGTLWTVVNERDMLGSDGPPDYLTTVDFGTFYGWPFFYWGGIQDQRVPQLRLDLQQYTKRPDYALGPHVAALGLAFNSGTALGARFSNGAFIGMHGSWNRYPAAGYKVVYVPFNERGFPTGEKPVDVLTGFLNVKGQAQGRPVGVIVDKKGALLVADDAGNRIWRVTAG